MAPAFWLSLKKPWQCKSHPSEVHDPTTIINNVAANNQTQERKSCGFVCSRSVSNLREIIHGGSKRYSTTEKPPTCSPRSVASCDLLNPITHEVFVSDSTCELKIGNFGDQRGFSSTILGILKPGTPRFVDPKMAFNRNSRKIQGRYSYSDVSGNRSGNSTISSNPRISVDAKLTDFSALTCKKCLEKFKTLDSFEEHRLSYHAVTELKEGDSSRKIVEIICKTSWSKSKETNSIQVQKVLKIHNLQTTITEFEQQRESVKNKANKLQTRHHHPRCVADGNELLRFHATTIACSLGINGCSNLCKFRDCGLCQILRYGFGKNGKIGVFTASTAGRALDFVVINEDKNNYLRKGLVICRVIAGRVHKPMENCEEFTGKSSFDSLAGKIGQYSNFEELYLLNPKALLPCFVVL